MRLAQLFEDKFVGSVKDLFATSDTDVFDVSTRQFLDRLLAKSRNRLRAVLFPDSLHAWDGSSAGHSAYLRQAWRDGAARIKIAKDGDTVEIGYYTWETSPETISAMPIIQRLFGGRANLSFVSLDDYDR